MVEALALATGGRAGAMDAQDGVTADQALDMVMVVLDGATGARDGTVKELNGLCKCQHPR